MTGQEFQRLLRFYLACVETEDRRSLTKKLSALHRSLVSPWDEEEPLFHPEAPEVVITARVSADRDLLLGASTLVPGAERFFYGYPLFLDEDGFLSPLFVTQVEVEHREDRQFAMRCAERVDIQVNHHLFKSRHVQPEELRAIQKELERDYGSFASRLQAGCEALGVPTLRFAPDRLEPYPQPWAPRHRWINRPILFKSARSGHARHLGRELEALGKYPRLMQALGTTAAGLLAGIGSPCSRRTSTQSAQLLQVLPLNDRQEQAAYAGLRSRLTVVTGPPGTGKSQVVVDLLASCALAGRPVLFASKNNKAVDVVRDRLRAMLGQERDWTLRLGSRRAMEESQREMDGRLRALRLDHDAPHAPTAQLLHGLGQKIDNVRRRIQNLERAQSECAGLEQRRRAAESLVDPTWVDQVWVDQVWIDSGAGGNGHRFDHVRLDRLTATAEALAGNRPAGLWLKLAYTFAPAALHHRLRAELASLAGVLPPRVRADLEAAADEPAINPFGNPFGPLADAYERLTRLSQWRAAEEACIRSLAAQRAEEPADALAERLNALQRRRARLARDELQAIWTARLARKAVPIRHALDRYFDLASRTKQSRGIAFVQILKQFTDAVRSVGTDLPIWIVTNLSARNALPLEPALFDLVILDEASQSDIASALPLLFRARRALIIGDPRQLRHISTLSSAEEERLAAECGVAGLLTTWSYNERSLSSRAEGAVIERGEVPLFLAEHYRSHPEIIEFPNHAFYQGRLIPRTATETLREKLEGELVGLFWHDIQGRVSWSAHSAINEREVQAVVDILDTWSTTGFLLRDRVDFGIVTPFRLQMERIDEAIRARPWWERVKGRLIVGTAHKFQGDERDVMIFSPVVAEGMLPRLVRWVADTDQLLNVAITRARAALHVVGDLKACTASGGFLGRFAASATAIHKVEDAGGA